MNTSEPELPVVTYEPNLDMALKMLKFLFQINNNQRTQRLSYETFYLHEINEMVDLQKDFYRWSQSQGHVSIENNLNINHLFNSLNLFHFFSVQRIFPV